MQFENLYQQGIEEASGSQILLENLFVVGLVISGTIVNSFFLFQGIPIIAIIYTVFAVVMLGIVLRKHVCTSCWYYGKKCHCGWGRLAAKLFPQNDKPHKMGAIEAGVTWATIMILPLIVFISYALKQTVQTFQWISFAVFLFFLVVNNVIHKKSCTNCKMRFMCPASASKKIK